MESNEALEENTNEDDQNERPDNDSSEESENREPVINSSQDSSIHQNSIEVFPTASLLLECAKDEYNKELERLHSLDNKASFFMSAIILVATIFIPFVPFGKIRGALSVGNDLQKAVTYITATLVVVAFGFLVAAFKHLYDAYTVKGFERFNIENLTDDFIMRSDRNSSEKGLCENYKNTIEKNIKKNDEKAEQIKDGIKNSAIGFLLLTISAIVMVCFIG